MVNNDLKLRAMAIGSLPHIDVDAAMKLVEENFSSIPFWPQLGKKSKKEDMIFQFLEAMPGLCVDEEKETVYLDNESDEFFEQLETLFMDYEEIVSDASSELINKYAITKDNSSTVNKFFDILKSTAPKYAKGHVAGPFTLTTSLTDKEKKCAYYDETLREAIARTLCLKALWQVRKIKEASPSTTPIIFIDEPSLSQLGTSAFITISKEDVIELIKEVANVVKAEGALCAIHCCGKCDWDIPIQAGVDIINLDGFFFAQNLSIFYKEIETFLKNNGIIAWGIVPTLDVDALAGSDIDKMLSKFDEAIGYLTEKGVDKSLIVNNSMVTPSCGAGGLSVELAEKAMRLTKELSEKLIGKY
jgi:methionine synthase II (cobalamin-independent)